MGGVSQHPLSTGSGMPMVSQQAIFSGSAGSMPPHLISQGNLKINLPGIILNTCMYMYVIHRCTLIYIFSLTIRSYLYSPWLHHQDYTLVKFLRLDKVS
jgi:hypothetical protein